MLPNDKCVTMLVLAIIACTVLSVSAFDLDDWQSNVVESKKNFMLASMDWQWDYQDKWIAREKTITEDFAVYDFETRKQDAQKKYEDDKYKACRNRYNAGLDSDIARISNNLKLQVGGLNKTVTDMQDKAAKIIETLNNLRRAARVEEKTETDHEIILKNYSKFLGDNSAFTWEYFKGKTELKEDLQNFNDKLGQLKIAAVTDFDPTGELIVIATYNKNMEDPMKC